MSSIVKIEVLNYPNPEFKYGVFRIEGFEIGRAEKKPDGWVLPRKRKVLTAHEAATAMLRDRLKAAQALRLKAASDEYGARMMLLALKREAA